MNYKRKANMALLVSAIFFCVCVVLRYFYKDMFIFKLMLFVSEASLVGGIADWFAVTALFTKPLGFPYHTEIIPRNRKAIINSTSNLVETDLLSKSTLKKQIDNISVVDYIVKYVDENKEVKAKVLEKLTKVIMNYINSKASGKLDVYIENVIKEEGKNINLSDKLKAFIQNKFIYENRVKWARDFLNKISKEEGYEKILAFSQKIFTSSDEDASFSFKSLLSKLNVVIADDLAAIIKSQLQNILTDLTKEDSILSDVCANNLIKSIEGIELSPASIEEWKLNLLEKTDFKPIIKEQLPSLIKEEVISNIIEKLWEYLKANTDFKNSINNGIREVIYKILEEKHNVIGSIASDTLNNFTDEKLNQFIEDKAGEDLQWIRINGSVLGGCIGLVLFLFLNLIYEPYIVQIIKGFFS
ncbi:DUF445 domain-containing protein [Inconstantimicrobium mannanitabidum]|uniref:Uncharacterized protein n=1 Tax=Inconstantimicrobium mannanitabidum TaxID=1604901 RepID=A0ACB5RE30_9CLOT|nr:DUF445 domain-containing protein [Clostridium sp. TW13]GKX67538.1 hypothetical protein rsdtw13_27960 [Clostridium sp. TW13]